MNPARFAIYAAVVTLFTAPINALATPTITCHCFTDRSYDPKEPALADPYFLASAQNSFFAAEFGVEKKSIVIKKQKGTASDDLWISYWLARQTGTPEEKLLKQRQLQTSWYKTIKSADIKKNKLGPRMAAIFGENVTDTRLADAVVDSLLLNHRLYRETDLDKLRQSGAGSKELIVAALISSKNGTPQGQIYHDVSRGGLSWGGMLQRVGINAQNLQAEVTALIK